MFICNASKNSIYNSKISFFTYTNFSNIRFRFISFVLSFDPVPEARSHKGTGLSFEVYSAFR